MTDLLKPVLAEAMEATVEEAKKEAKLSIITTLTQELKEANADGTNNMHAHNGVHVCLHCILYVNLFECYKQ